MQTRYATHAEEQRVCVTPPDFTARAGPVLAAPAPAGPAAASAAPLAPATHAALGLAVMVPPPGRRKAKGLSLWDICSSMVVAFPRTQTLLCTHVLDACDCWCDPACA